MHAMGLKQQLFVSLFGFSALAFAGTPADINPNEVDTVGGKLTIKTFETDPRQLVLDSSTLPIAENFYRSSSALYGFRLKLILFSLARTPEATPPLTSITWYESEKISRGG